MTLSKSEVAVFRVERNEGFTEFERYDMVEKELSDNSGILNEKDAVLLLAKAGAQEKLEVFESCSMEMTSCLRLKNFFRLGLHILAIRPDMMRIGLFWKQLICSMIFLWKCSMRKSMPTSIRDYI